MPSPTHPSPAAGRDPRRFVRGACALVAGFIAAQLFGCANTPTQPQAGAVDTSKVDATIAASGLAADALYPVGEMPVSDSPGVEPVAVRRTLDRLDLVRSYRFDD